MEAALQEAIRLLPEGRYDGEPTAIDIDLEDELGEIVDLRPENRQVREGSFFIDISRGLMQMVDGAPVEVKVRKGRTGDGIPEKHVGIIKKLIPIRDAVREVLKAQEQDRPWRELQMRIAWSSFVRDFGPINHTTVSISEDEESGEVRETHRRPNLQPFLDDPDCWLVASIEDYDLDTDTAKPGPIFSERVISPPAPPEITSAEDALAVVLNERGRVDVEHIAELLHRPADAVADELGDAIFRDPADDPGRRPTPILPARSAPSLLLLKLRRRWFQPTSATSEHFRQSNPPTFVRPISPHASVRRGFRRATSSPSCRR